MEKTKLGLSQNIEAAIAYSMPPFSVLSGLALLVLEPENKFVRFHAMQSFMLFGFYWLLGCVINFIPFLRHPLNAALGIVILVSWLVLIYNAYKGRYCKVPVIGDVIYERIVG